MHLMLRAKSSFWAAVLILLPVTVHAQFQEGEGNYADFNWDCSTASPAADPFETVSGSGNSTSSSSSLGTVVTISGSYSVRNQDAQSPYGVLPIGGADDATGVTIELEVQVKDGQTVRAFGVTWIDEGGGVGLWWSDGKIEAGPAVDTDTSKLVPHTMDTTTDIHKYRITQSPDSNDIRVYVDGTLEITITDVDDSVTLGSGRVHLGRIGTFTLDDADVVIDNLNIQNRPAAPMQQDTQWDGEWDGTDTAAHGSVPYLRWDSAIDDDWGDQPDIIFDMNTPQAGLMTVDRKSRTEDQGKTGNIWIRDPVLSHEEGVTMEVGVKIDDNSDDNAFSITYLDDDSCFGVHLSPDNIRVGSLYATGSGSDTAFDTTDRYHIYRIVKDESSMNVRVYVDNCPTAIASGTGSPDTTSGGANDYLRYPRILIGDNENLPTYNAHYIMDFARYRRGAINPDQTPVNLSDRALPLGPLPQEVWKFYWDCSTASPAADPFETVAGSGNSTSGAEVTISGSYSVRNQDAQSPYGVLPIDEADDATGVTIELDVKVAAGSTDRAFGVTWIDEGGGVGLWWSDGKIEAGPAVDTDTSKLVPHTMDTTDKMHRYRITQSANSNDIRVYVDGTLEITITDVDDSVTLGSGCVNLGRIGTFTLDDAEVVIDNLKVHSGDSMPVAWNEIYDGEGQPGGNWNLGGASAWEAQSDGTTILNGVTHGGANARNDTAGDLWTNMQAITVEARLKVLSGHEDATFNLVVNDQLGETSLNLSDDKVELSHSGMPGGVGTTNANFNPETDVWHTYRLTRDRNGLYWHLFIDDEETARIAHQHSAGNLLSFSRIWFGDLSFPVPANDCKVQIDYIRWVEDYIAPEDLP